MSLGADRRVSEPERLARDSMASGRYGFAPDGDENVDLGGIAPNSGKPTLAAGFVEVHRTWCAICERETAPRNGPRLACRSKGSRRIPPETHRPP
jgi:hypothetical protein